MTNPTVQNKPAPRTRVRNAAGAQQYKRQTARLEGRRDGKPLIFGWGKHLTRAQKQRYQRTAAYGFFGLVLAGVIFTLSFGWLQQNVLIPNETLLSVNGTRITQDTYRKTLAVEAQVIWNRLQSEIKQMDEAQIKASSGDQNAATQQAALTAQIQTDEGLYQQAQITANTATAMTEDLLIQQGAREFERVKGVPASTFEPTTREIDKALDGFKKAFPANEKYSDFVSKNGLSDADVRAALTMQLRRDKMQAYLSSLIVSPTRQARVRHLEANDKATTEKLRAEVIKTGDWTKLAKEKSLDPNTKDKGGDLGWISFGIGDAAIEQWAMAPGRKVNEISPALRDASGTWSVVQITAFDDKHTIDANQLNAAKSNALNHWLGGQKVRPDYSISKPVSDMVTASRNMPKLPDLNAQLPNVGQAPSIGG